MTAIILLVLMKLTPFLCGGNVFVEVGPSVVSFVNDRDCSYVGLHVPHFNHARKEWVIDGGCDYAIIWDGRELVEQRNRWVFRVGDDGSPFTREMPTHRTLWKWETN